RRCHCPNCTDHRGLIYVSISGYGEDGPYRKQKAQNGVRAKAGFWRCTKGPRAMRAWGYRSVTSPAGETAFSAVLQALIARGRTGEGRFSEVSLFHTMADWMNVPYLQTRYGGQAPERVGLRHPSLAPSGTFACADGRQVLLSVSEREGVIFADKVLGQPALHTDSRYVRNVGRVAHMAEIDALIARVLASLTRDEAINLLTKAGIACGSVSTLDDMPAHPQARQITVDSPSGPVKMMGRGVRHAGQVAQFGAVPALGQETEAILADFSKEATS
ncbi:MAG: CaiB/BaiF CoA-transferase family protein, partial [Pseudomonadota bacterium]